MEFKEGDQVKLKSGGPIMTVEKVGEDMLGTMTVWCVWFDRVGNKQVLRRGEFPPVTLASFSGVSAISGRIVRS